ncbi:LytTR family DNA-binding domain-containing protein [Mangrovimonas sp. AS39]|uniref:LytR/AlgR family response regulator transcription factor n=1 Tax=Mangrovimonas futianensis TaxID=2895523 RepID=UPI001E3C049F|nr:LytTR family DNA-binding domain-containing protein [Mangrovimonas futianensis]MCF1192767.1 LytTR family DNA-binding domain-containing protein [Mangrovimonas futianensis]MCF1196313.1 LytTR family DNA-binding domain-containing protein [Mangrovimonas futianensis]
MAKPHNISCLIVDDESMAREIIRNHLSKIDNITVVAECKNAMEAFNYLNSLRIDLIFLDIQMPEISGISFAKSINPETKIIFTTAFRDYAVEGFELKAVDYLLKPITFERLLKAINTYFEVYSSIPTSNKKEPETNQFMFVRSDRRMLKIDFDTIYFIESFSDYLKIHLENEVVVTRENISTMEGKLPQKQFIRIHRSFIVALNKMDSYTNDYVIIQNKSLTISRSYKKDVLEVLVQY